MEKTNLSSRKTWHCQCCDKDVPIKVRGYLVGTPSVFLVCRNCWKYHILPLSRSPSKIIRGAVNLHRTDKTEREIIEDFLEKEKID